MATDIQIRNLRGCKRIKKSFPGLESNKYIEREEYNSQEVLLAPPICLS